MSSKGIIAKLKTMGEKGAKLSSDSNLAAEQLLSVLNRIPNISSKKMFGGHGVFHEGKMFCMVDSKGQSFLKVDDDLKSVMSDLGGIPHSKMPYFSIPASVLKNDQKLLELAQVSIELSK